MKNEGSYFDIQQEGHNDLSNPASLKYSWTATVKLNNGQTIDIWHTVWPTLKHCVKEIITIASDYPRHQIK